MRRSILALANATAKLIDDLHFRQLTEQFESLQLPFPTRRSFRIRQELDGYTERNEAFFRDLTEETIRRISETVDRSVTRAFRVEDLAKELEHVAQVQPSRARLIARDQTLKLYGNLTEARHFDAGIARYVWSTAGDERVRDGHAALNGTVQSWSAPPDTGNGQNHPGQDVQCRCVAVPVIE